MIHQTTLENGIRVVTESMSGVRSLSLGFLVEASPQDDPSGRAGLAHFTEHALFLGTASRDTRRISRMMDVFGGHGGAFTTRDYTCFGATVLDDYRTYALELFGDLLLNSTYPEERIEREKLAVHREIAGANDDLALWVDAAVKQAAWQDHPLGRPTRGVQSGVEAIQREDVIYFVAENYTPDRLIVAGAGSLDHDDFVAQVRDSFWRMSGTRGVENRPDISFESEVIVREADAAQSYFAIAFEASPYAHADRYLTYALTGLLGGGMSSRLYRYLREERGLVYNVNCEYHPYRDSGVIVIAGSTQPSNVLPVMELVLGELCGIASGMRPPTVEEVKNTISQITANHLLESEHTNARMSRLLMNEEYFGKHDGSEETLARISEIDAVSLAEFAVGFMPCRLGRASVALAGPSLPSGNQRSDLIKLVGSLEHAF